MAGLGALDLKSPEIDALFVRPQYAGSGVGSELLKDLELAARSITDKLTVSSTLNAESFYSKHGYVRIDEDVILRDGEKIEAVKMEKEL